MGWCDVTGNIVTSHQLILLLTQSFILFFWGSEPFAQQSCHRQKRSVVDAWAWSVHIWVCDHKQFVLVQPRWHHPDAAVECLKILGQSFSLFTYLLLQVSLKHTMWINSSMPMTQLYMEFTTLTATASIHYIKTCLIALQASFAMNGLALNLNKTEVIQMSTTPRAKELSPATQIEVAESTVRLSGQLKLPGVALAAALNFVRKIKNVCKASFFHIQILHHIRPSLTEETANCVASLVQSRLDYANSLYTGMSSANFNKLQRIQNMLVHIILLSKKRDYISSVLKGFIGFRFAKTSTTWWLSSHTEYGSLLSRSTLEHYWTVRLCSNQKSTKRKDIVVPRIKLVIVSCAFSVTAPHIWNSLPPNVTSSGSVALFFKRLDIY